MRRVVVAIVAAPFVAVLALVHFLTAVGIWFLPWPAHPTLRGALVACYAIALVVLVVRARLWRALLLSLVGPLVVNLCYGFIEPRADAVYPPETSRMPVADIVGDRVTLHDVRNFEYRSETDFDARWDTRSFALSDVRTVDLMACYWTAGERIAHTFLSFGFADGTYLAASIEIRRELDEEYGPLQGLYRRYELIYVWGDERDLIRVRTNDRKEKVHLYRTTCSPHESRLLLESYLRETNALAAEPAFYNTITRNCTSCIVRHINEVLARKMPWYKRRLMNGLGDRRAYENGWIVGSGPFELLRDRSNIDERAQAADADPEFSRLIRTHFAP